MHEKEKQYDTNSEFLEFLNSEFNKTAVDATMEDMAEFAFGSMELSIKAFEERGKMKNRRIDH